MRPAVLLLIALSPVLIQAGQASSPYRISHTYSPGGDGGWDYIIPDPPPHRLFIGRRAVDCSLGLKWEHTGVGVEREDQQ